MSRKIVWFGARGPDVVDLQRILTDVGCYTPAPGHEDPPGEFGPQTDAAVRAFLNRHGMVETPIVDSYLWELLDGTDGGQAERQDPPSS